MSSKRTTVVFLAALALTFISLPVAAQQPDSELEMYTLEGSAGMISEAVPGLELAGLRHTAAGIKADAVLTRGQRAKLDASGVKVTVKRNSKGQSVSEQAAAQAQGGYNVYRSWDEPGGIRDELNAIAQRNPQLVKRVVLGRSVQGREIIGLKLTQGARDVPDGSRPAVLYSSLQHAREWISLEVNRRMLHHFIDAWRANDKEIRRLLKNTELWFVIAANPDGYQFAFDHERLWRKNLRDNNGDGQITVGDGVDPNRNFNEHWGYDNEGSSPDPADETYRGPSPASEPETRALAGLIDRVRPRFQSNLHSFGEWLLYPQGWQVGTPDADNPLYVALGGTDANPAIRGFNPGQSADTLYVTNGETTDYADTNAGTIAYTPELGEGVPGAGFVFPDDEALIQAEFEKTLSFHLGLARSAVDPDDPVSPVGINAEPFYLDQDDIDPQNGQQSLFDFRFAVSYGDPQEVRVLAKRSLGAVTLKYRIGDGPVQSAPTSEWTGGERYGPGNAKHYRVMRGTVTGTSAGDSVTVWFEGGGATSGSFTYKVASDTGRRVLIVAAEDYTGASPAKPGVTAPQYLSFYAAALDVNGVAYDVYDVDARGRTAPDNLGVLSHYDAVLWYTGDDVVTRELGWGPGNASRLAMQELLEVRDFLNDGGRVLYTGQRAGQQYTQALGTQLYDPFENRQCRADPTVLARCLALSGSGNSQGDPIEYFFGAAITTPGGGLDPATGDPFPISGIDDPLTGLALGRNGADSAQNQGIDSSFIATGDFLRVTDPAHSFPHLDSRPAARYESGIAGPFDPHSGQKFMWSDRADEAYKRLTRTITVPAAGATLSFWTSYNLELDFDYMIVEAHTVGQDNWTTLPDQNGHTSSDLSNDLACTNGWSNPNDPTNVLHPFLTRYQTFDPATGTCSNTGTTGTWHAANGSSSGWQQWQIDLAPYAGQQVEIAITALSDWGLQQFPGVFVDDIEVSTGEGTTSFEDDADPTDGWTVPGAPQDQLGIEGPNRNDWVRRAGLGISEGAAVATVDTVYLGFGFEGITGSATRNQVMDRLTDYLLRSTT
ncbi:immune inhibitor A peptidase M6 [Kribbella sp. VKM Ac-2527]|uniref:Zinc carboxypeptidase n=1 Tax=Kribbella caucasensis TaxID=2512215 RepID=A0A4R6JCE9_9ACTN|nr:M14 family metallopeptidase [Kribbella sp. VKM Ac-2527]TDO33232.1 immune inhibitor A peptidase M6 [Kribbella sp. VKM Ac-2527]